MPDADPATELAGGRPDAAPVLLGLFHQLHRLVDAEVAALDDDGLNWVPAPGANSVATVVTHLLGSEAETLRAVAGVDAERDRDAEFAHGARDRVTLLGETAAADRLLGELGPLIDEGRLGALVALPTLPATDRRTGLAWLVANYGHAREHLGHLQLTAQLYRGP